MKGWNRFRRQFGVIRPVSAQKNRKFFGYRKTFSISAKPKTEIFSAKPKAENFQQKPKTENFSVMMSHFPFLANNSHSCPLSSDFHHSIKETILRIGNLEKIRNSPENFSGNKIRENMKSWEPFLRWPATWPILVVRACPSMSVEVSGFFLRGSHDQYWL